MIASVIAVTPYDSVLNLDIHAQRHNAVHVEVVHCTGTCTVYQYRILARRKITSLIIQSRMTMQEDREYMYNTFALCIEFFLCRGAMTWDRVDRHDSLVNSHMRVRLQCQAALQGPLLPYHPAAQSTIDIYQGLRELVR